MGFRYQGEGAASATFRLSWCFHRSIETVIQVHMSHGSQGDQSGGEKEAVRSGGE